VDCAENFVRASEEGARAEGVPNTQFFVADVQRDDLRGPMITPSRALGRSSS
jgi:hypothetical protein